MPKKTPIEQQADWLSRMATALFNAATEEVPGWNELFYDVRYDGDCGLGRTVVRKGKDRVQIDSPDEVDEGRLRLLSLRKKLHDGYWYGLSIYVNSEGTVDVKFNKDAKCIRTFAEDEKNHRPF